MQQQPKQRQPRRNRSRGQKDTIARGTIKFYDSLLITSSAVKETKLINSLALSLSELAATYRYFRYTRVKITAYPPPSALSTGVALWYVPSGVLTAPTSIADAEGEHLIWVGADNYQMVPLTMTIPRKALINEVEWFITQDSGGVDELDTPGYLLAAVTSSTTTTIRVVFEIDFEFKGLVEPSVLLLQQRERALLLNRRDRESRLREEPPPAETSKEPTRN
jgi:hypothetical protein